MNDLQEISDTEKNSRETHGFHEFTADKETSSRRKYQNLIIGDYNLLNLFKYELLTLSLSNIPGALGILLRQKFYKYLFKKLGKGVLIGSGVSLRQPSKISIGRGCLIDDLVRLSARGGHTAGIYLKENVFIGRGSILNVRDGQITINSNSDISSFCRIATDRGKIQIGEYVLIAAYCYIGGGNHKTGRRDIPMLLQGFESKGGVTIGDDVWIGSHTVVSDGVTIGKGAIIGAHSFVNKDIPEYSIAFGSPARVYKERD
jgi:acetyltransferase-like isoleucine patch superfamily enzyme